MLDPGIGFGKTIEHNLELLRRLDELVAIGRPLVIGTSRKSFLGRITGRDGPDERVAGTIATNVLAYERGARVFRVHDVAPVRDALAVTAATVSARWRDDPTSSTTSTRTTRTTRGTREPEVTIEISGLSLFTHVGVTAAEREVGQRLLLDLRLDVGECDATVTDRIEDTVDYAQVCETANLVAQQRSYKTLERLCAAIADRLLERYDADAVWVKAAKPEPPMRAAGERGVGRGVARGRVTEAVTGYLGLGSNVGDRRGHLRARRGRAAGAGVTVLASSSVYETEPVGEVLDQRDFFNACLRVETEHDPEQLLDACKGVERDAGPRARRRPPRSAADRRRRAAAGRRWSTAPSG